MDRLEQKGIVTRRKVGRAFHYQPRLTAEEARLQAVRKIVEGFFDGSPEALAAHLSSQSSGAWMAGDSPSRAAPPATPTTMVDAPETPVAELPTPNLDERLL
jgi:Penicillinase repressor